MIINKQTKCIHIIKSRFLSIHCIPQLVHTLLVVKYVLYGKIEWIVHKRI